MNADIDAGNHKVINVTTPTLSSDAATKNYVDTKFNAIDYYGYCDVATTINLSANYSNGVSGVGATLTMTAVGVLIVDSVTVALNDRILVKN